MTTRSWLLAVWFTVRHITGPMWPLSFPMGCNLSSRTWVSQLLPGCWSSFKAETPPSPGAPQWGLFSLGDGEQGHPPPFLVIPGEEGSLRACQHLATEPRLQQGVTSQCPPGREGGKGKTRGVLMLIPPVFLLLLSSAQLTDKPPIPSSFIAAHHPLGPIGKGPESPYSRQLPLLKRLSLSLGVISDPFEQTASTRHP